MKKRVYILPIALLTVFAHTSCRDSPCIDENKSYLRMSIYVMDTNRTIAGASKQNLDSFFFMHPDGGHYFQQMTDTQAFVITLPMMDGPVSFALGKMALDTVYRDTSYNANFDNSYTDESNGLTISYNDQLFLLTISQSSDTLFAYTVGAEAFDSLISSNTYLSLATDGFGLLTIDSSFSVWGDTLTLEISYRPHQVSEECGFTAFYTIDRIDYTNNLLDTVELNINEVRNDQEEEIEHIRLYY